VPPQLSSDDDTDESDDPQDKAAKAKPKKAAVDHGRAAAEARNVAKLAAGRLRLAEEKKMAKQLANEQAEIARKVTLPCSEPTRPPPVPPLPPYYMYLTSSSST
jgi:hypothetical protein